jgi:hypothetical protein
MRTRHAAGYEVTAESQPRLIALVAEAARAAGAEPPDEVTVSLAPRAEVVELRRRRRGVVIGLSLIAMVSEPELRALLAHAFGAGTADAKRRVDAQSGVWDEYWLNHVAPALDVGRLPPVVEGLTTVLPGPPGEALELLDGLEQLERDVMGEVIGGRLEPMEWSEFGEVYLTGARQSVIDAAPVLKGLTVAGIGEAVAEIGPLASRVERLMPTLPRDMAPEVAVQALTDGLVVALADAGWEVVCDVDKPLLCRRGDHRIEPLEEMGRLAEGTRSASAWATQARELGIADLPLGRP